jgi:transposase-like protein
MTPRKSPKAPPFCPNSKCPFHCGDTTSWKWSKNGTFTAGRSGRSTQRYICHECGRSFSRRTFRSTYWLKRPDVFLRVARGLVSCSGFRQIAAGLGVSPQTVARHASRLGKQALLFHETMRQKHPVEEPLALDSFVSFTYSQYFPTHFHFAIGRESHFAYGFIESEVRRSGTMTRAQRARRAFLEETLGRPDPKAREKDVAELLKIVLEGAKVLHLTTDEDQAYPRAIRRSGLDLPHDTINSRAERSTRNPLFASNLHDLQIRHGSANHKRETISFSKLLASAIDRMWLHLAWKNYVKPFSEKKGGPTPAMRAGFTDRKWTFRQMFRRRRFPDRVGLPERWRVHFDGTTPTRAYGSRERNRPRFAY